MLRRPTCDRGTGDAGSAWEDGQKVRRDVLRIVLVRDSAGLRGRDVYRPGYGPVERGRGSGELGGLPAVRTALRKAAALQRLLPPWQLAVVLVAPHSTHHHPQLAVDVLADSGLGKDDGAADHFGEPAKHKALLSTATSRLDTRQAQPTKPSRWLAGRGALCPTVPTHILWSR